MFCPRLLLLFVLVAGLFASVSAQPTTSRQREHSRRVSACSDKLNRYGLSTAKKFCVAYLHGRKPASSTSTLTLTQTRTSTSTTTLAPVTTTTVVPATVTSTESTTVSETTTTTLSQVTTTTTTTTETTTPTSTESETATETETVTVSVTDDGSSGQRKRRRGLASAPTDDINLEKRSALTSQQSSSIYGSFLDSEITDACLLLLYGRISATGVTRTSTATTTATKTSTPAPITTTSTSTTTATVTDTETESFTATETTFTATSTDTSTSTVEGPATTVTTTVATTTETVTSTSTVAAPVSTATTGVVSASFSDGSASKYVVALTDGSLSNSRRLGFVDTAAAASSLTLDKTTGILSLTSDTTFSSHTLYTATTYLFRMAQEGAASTEGRITCALQSGTNQLTCATDAGYTVLQKCSSYLSIGQTNGCGNAVTLTLQ